MKKNLKKILGVLLAVVLVCTSVSVIEPKEVQAADSSFESMIHTEGKEKVTAATGGHTNLGQVSSVSSKFTFKLTHPGSSITGNMKIGLFNTSAGNVWSGGYILTVGPRTDSTADFALRNAVGEDLLSYPGTLSVTADDYMTISAWIESGTIHITVNETEIITYTDSSISVGTYMGVYNEWSASAEFVHVDAPSFESILSTAGAESLSANNGGYLNMQQVSSVGTKFAFYLNVPSAASSGDLKIGFYNTAGQNPWANGYIVVVSQRSTEGTLGFALRKGNGEGLLAIASDMTFTEDTILIQTWIESNTLYVSVNGEVIFTYTNDGTITTGAYMSAYNGWTEAAVVTNVAEELIYEELDTTAGVNTIDATNGGHTNLGNVSSSERGFRFRMTNPGTTSGGQMKIGLYNTTAGNVWSEGYILNIVAQGGNGSAQFKLLANTSANGEAGTLAENTISGLTGDYLTISTYVKNDIIRVYANDTLVLAYAHDGTYDITPGKYMGVYNEWGQTMTFKTLGMTMEDLNSTLGVQSVDANAGATVNLGQLDSAANGFTFQVTHPRLTRSGDVKIGLYNTTTTNPWSYGYILTLSGRTSEDTVGIALRNGNGEGLLVNAGDISGLTGRYLTVTVYIEDNVLHVSVNDKEVIAYTNEGAVTIGTYMSAYNGWNKEIKFRMYAEEIEFEQLDTTLGKQTTKVGSAVTGNLGQVSSIEKGFAFKVSNPRTTNSDCDMKIGLFNTATTNPWADGYYLALSGRASDGTVGIAIRKGSGENLLGNAGDISGFTEDYITVYTWIENNTFYVEINETEYFAFVNDGTQVDTIAVGTYLSVYNGWNDVAEFRILGEVVEEVPITYEDVKDTAGIDSATMANAEYLDMGQVKNNKDYFMFQVSRPEITASEENFKIGLYNTEAKNPWAGGYILSLNTKTTDGTIGWSVRSDGETVLVGFDDISGLAGDYITVATWLTNVNSTTGAHVLHIAIDGTEIVTYTNDESVASGNYMSAYNGWTQDATVSAMFEDLGATAEVNSASAANTGYIDMGAISDMEKGFRFKVTNPNVTEEEENFKIGFYNTAGNDAWAGGYILSLNTKTTDGLVGWSVRGGGETTLVGFSDLTDKYDEYLTVHVWLTKVDEAAGTHVLHIAIDGVEIVTYTHDGSFDTGANMCAYNGWTQTAEMLSFYAPNIKFTVNNINELTAFDTTANVWKIYLNADDNIPNAANMAYTWSVNINGTAYATNLVKASDTVGNLVYFTIAADTIPQSPDKNYEVTMVPMSAEATDSNGDVWGITLKEQYSFFVRTDTRVLDVTYTYAEDSDVLGDSDGDASLTSKDLVRMKRYVAGEALVNNQGDLTLADDDVIDNKDIRVLRKLIVGLIDASTGEYVDNYVASGLPEYSEEDEFRIGAYQGPRAAGKNDYSVKYTLTSKYVFPSYKYYKDIDSVTGTTVDTSFINDYEFQQYADAGFNTLISEADASYSLGSNQAANKLYMELARNHDLNVIMLPSKLASYLREETPEEGEAAVKEEIAALYAEYGKYDNFLGLQMADEILVDSWTTTRFSDIKDFVQNELGYGDSLLYSLQPRRALGVAEAGDDDNLETLMNFYGKTNGLYEYCYYPFEKELTNLGYNFDLTGATVDTGYTDAFQQENWFNYLSQVAATANDNGIKRTGIAVQSSGYEHPVSNKEPSRYDISTKAEVGFQVYTALAYGMKTLNYFTYWEHYAQSTDEYFTSAMVLYPENGGAQSVKTDLYYAVKDVNTEIKKFDHVLSDFDWKGTIDVNGTVSGDDGASKGYTVNSNSRLASVATSSSSDQIVVGCMKDSDGFDGYMIADAQNPTTAADGTTTTVTLTFNNATKALVYVNGEEQTVELTNGVYTATVGAGEGVFVIPLV